MSDIKTTDEVQSEGNGLTPDVQVEVKNLWKVFGRDPKRIVKMKDKTKEEIRKKTGAILALRDISLSINRGEFFILMGLSGSGKSTLLRHFMRLMNPTSGHILVNGKNINKMNQETLLQFRREMFGMVFQHYGLFPHMTVLDNAAYGLKIKGVPRGERYVKAMRTLESVGLKGWEDYYPGSLSGGMQQRVGLARALANDPEILLMDEPFSGLDPLIRRQMQDELVELQATLKKTIIFVTHDLHEALKLGDRIAIMRNGSIVQEGTPEEIVTQPADDYVHEFVRDASPAKVITVGCIMEEPNIVLYDWEGPKTALTLLRKQKRASAFVVNRLRQLMGVITEERLEKLLAKGDTKSGIPTSIIRKVPSVTEDTILEDLFSIVSENPYPIPVVDEKGRFKGKVTTDQIFESISPAEGEEND